jgi:excisionase family DNA binding protein
MPAEVNPTIADELLTVDELAAFLKCTRWTIYNMSRKRGTQASIPSLKIGRALRYRKSSVVKYLAQIERASL